jgi:hypothetical protein
MKNILHIFTPCVVIIVTSRPKKCAKFNVLTYKLLHVSALIVPSSGGAIVQNNRHAILSSLTKATLVRSSMCDLRGEYVYRNCKKLNFKELNYKNYTD